LRPQFLTRTLCIVVLVAGCVLHAGESRSEPVSPLQVRVIRFEGLHSFSPAELKKVLVTREKKFGWFTRAPLEEKTLAEDIERLEKYLVSHGFYHARVHHEVQRVFRSEVRLLIRVEEGPPMTVSRMNLVVDGASSGPWHREVVSVLPLREGDRFTIPAYEDIEKRVLLHFSDWGFPKVRIDVRARLDKKSNTGVVAVDVTRGPVCFFGAVKIEGNEQVSDEVILREFTFHQGERFSAAKVQETQQRLFNLDLFQLVDFTVEKLDTNETVLPVRVLVKESKPQTIRVGAGYGTEDQFRGQAQWEIRNFLGDGRRLQVNMKASSLVQLAETKFVQPYFLYPRSTLTVEGGGLHEDQESYENRKFYLKPVLNYKWTDTLSTFIGHDLEANRLLDVKLDAPALSAADQEQEEYFVSSFLGGVVWEKVDNTLNPKKGWRVLPNLEVASAELGSNVEFVKFTLEGRGYVPVRDFGVLAAKLKWGGIRPMEGTPDIPIFKRFFAGGTDSVRGYPYQRLGPLDGDGNPIGGMTLVEGSLEWRFPVYKEFDGVLFFDFGNVYSSSFEILWDDLRYSAGCGIRYNTIVGPLRLDFGYALNPPEGDFFSPFQVHFSIGQAF